jgi:hypothetical protein
MVMPYKPVPKKKAAPKGGGKAASGINLYTPVKQATIDKIKGMGMSASLKKAATSKNAEFVQGVKRMYGADRLKKAMKAASAPAPRTSRTTSATAPKAPQPRTSRTTSATKSIGTGPNKVNMNDSRVKKASGKGLFPGLLSGNYQGKKIPKGKVAGKGFFKS